MGGATPNIDRLFAPGDRAALLAADHGDPFAVLGPHRDGSGLVVRAFVPGATTLSAVVGAETEAEFPLIRCDPAGLFAGQISGANLPFAYRLKARAGEAMWTLEDPYRFGPVIGETDEHLISEGTHQALFDVLGAHCRRIEGIDGVHFAVWAPGARRVSVVGPFNDWDGRRHPMRARGRTGVWEIFLPGIGEGTVYKYEIRSRDGTVQPLKADPLGFGAEVPPATASIVRDLSGFSWSDEAWMGGRGERQRIDSPVTIYEVHPGSWRRREDGSFLSYRELAETLVPYARDMGFTHLELLPVSEHPFAGSWGYQPVGLYAPTSRFGTPEDFRQFVEACHRAELGVILDWVPGHFPADEHGLARFDGTHLYEHADPRQGFHPDWNTLVFNYGRPEVVNYLTANALFWLKTYHADGLRVDAVASMLYLDYSRQDGQWIPNAFGGNENLEAIAFLKTVNRNCYGADDTILTVAEESTAWPGVSRPTESGGLGFGFKWNMGWMNDTLAYMGRDPVHRRHHHHQMTFALHYAYSENFILPLSHDEVVHGKGSLYQRMPGDRWQKFANLRAYLGFMWGHPGKKLLFMGGEFGQDSEWNHDTGLPWHLLDDPGHAGVQRMVRDLNRAYRAHGALFRRDSDPDGFRWILPDAAAESILVFARFGGTDDLPVVVVCNFTPVPREDWRIGLPRAGRWREIINTDAADYGGSGIGNLGGMDADEEGWHGQPASAAITLPPLATLMLVPDPS